jgi:hypothetical protein
VPGVAVNNPNADYADWLKRKPIDEAGIAAHTAEGQLKGYVGVNGGDGPPHPADAGNGAAAPPS